MDHGSLLLLALCRVIRKSYFEADEVELALDEVGHDGLDGGKGHAEVVKREALLHFERPVLVALCLPVFLDAAEHDDELHFLLVDHAPEVLAGGWKGPLGGDEELVVLVRRCVDVVGVYERIINISVPLHQPNPCVLD